MRPAGNPRRPRLLVDLREEQRRQTVRSAFDRIRNSEKVH